MPRTQQPKPLPSQPRMRSSRLASPRRISERRVVLATALGLALASAMPFSACVTVNVNFPESAVQKATDDYVRDLYRARERGKPGTPPPSPSATGAFRLPTGLLLLSAAWASEVEAFRVNTAKSQAIKEKLRSRLDEVLIQKRAGVLGESDQGGLVIHDPSALKPLLAAKVQRLVSDENNDRNALYEEVLVANALPPARLKNVQKSFARSFQAESPSGTWVQDADGKWTRKP